ncbi:MAG: fibrobacter succinogenes major paralogous domain-containing protein, partial [Dysgonamonadaceae bacterium]|nr:fibrobacter succinogenes major paralogous domain-containing protein [Dysgonamonadaceae bacterium]
ADQGKTLQQQLTYEPKTAQAGEGVATDKAYDPIVYGEWYQWGRKKDGHEDRRKSVTNSSYLSSAGGVGVVADSLDASGQIKDNLPAISGKFIQRNAGTSDWRQYPETAENSAGAPTNDWTWGNPALNPCKNSSALEHDGNNWRVPTLAEWAQIQSNNTWVWQDGGANGTSGYQLKPGGMNKPTSLFLSAAGGRARSGGAQLNVGYNGYYWSTTTTGTNSYALGFAIGSITVASTNNRAGGLTVRCVSE